MILWRQNAEALEYGWDPSRISYTKRPIQFARLGIVYQAIDKHQSNLLIGQVKHQSSRDTINQSSLRARIELD